MFHLRNIRAPRRPVAGRPISANEGLADILPATVTGMHRDASGRRFGRTSNYTLGRDFWRLARRMFSSCERTRRFLRCAFIQRGKVATKISSRVAATPLLKPPNAKNRQISVSSHRAQAMPRRIQRAFKNRCAVQIGTWQMRETTLPIGTSTFRKLFRNCSAIVSRCSAPV